MSDNVFGSASDQATIAAKVNEQIGSVEIAPTEGLTVGKINGELYYIVTNPGLGSKLVQLGYSEVQPGVVVLPVDLTHSMGLAKLGANMRGMESVRYTEEWPLYAGAFEIMTHQLATSAFIINNHRCIIANEQRTGKTFSFIAAMEVMRKRFWRGATLIIAPLTLLELVWEREIEATNSLARVHVLRDQGPKYRTTKKPGRRPRRKKIEEAKTAVEVLRGARDDMAKAYGEYHEVGSPTYELWTHRRAPYLVMDPDILRHNEEFREELTGMMRAGFITVVGVDESTFFANFEAARTQALREVLVAAPYENLRVIMMTGTPGNPKKVFTQTKLCDPVRCYLDEHEWENRTTILGSEIKIHKEGSGRRNPRRRFAKPGWIRHVIDYIAPIIRFETEEVVGTTVHAPELLRAKLSDEQQEAYDLVSRESLLVYQNAGGALTAKELEHSMTIITKARQISLGTYLTEEGERIELDYTPRLETIIDIIKNAKKKTIVFCSYTAPTYRLAKDLTARGIKNVVITGDITNEGVAKERTAAADAFQNDDSVRVMLAHPQTVAYGVEASAGNTIVWNGPVAEGAETYSQGCSRCSSVKQDEEVFIYHLAATPYEDMGFYSLENSLDEREVFLRYAKRMTETGEKK